MMIYYKDFDGNGSMDIVEAEYEDDNLYPVRGRSCSSGAMPFVADKFPTFNGFAKANLEAIYDIENAWRQPETGLMAGGLGLKGTDDGEFIAQWPKESGIVMPEPGARGR